MRVSKVAFYTFAVLVSREFSSQAIATPVLDGDREDAIQDADLFLELEPIDAQATLQTTPPETTWDGEAALTKVRWSGSTSTLTPLVLSQASANTIVPDEVDASKIEWAIAPNPPTHRLDTENTASSIPPARTALSKSEPQAQTNQVLDPQENRGSPPLDQHLVEQRDHHVGSQDSDPTEDIEFTLSYVPLEEGDLHTPPPSLHYSPPDPGAERAVNPPEPQLRVSSEAQHLQVHPSHNQPPQAQPAIQFRLTQLPDMVVAQNSVIATQSFPDIQGHWAQDIIEPLAQRNIVTGFPDGTFRPDSALTRAQFAAMINQAFQQPFVRGSVEFVDVPSSYWAADAIDAAYRMGFFNGYPSQVFNPEQNISRADTLVTLTEGLDLEASEVSVSELDLLFSDAESIPGYAEQPIAEAVEHRLVVNYPDVMRLRPTAPSTRAEAAAAIYQALVAEGELPELQSAARRYIVSHDQLGIPQLSPEEQLEALREQYQLPQPPIVEDPVAQVPSGIVSAPGFTISSPTAFGADWRDIFFAAGFQERTRYSDQSDGGIGLGLGIGNAQRAVGLEIGFTIVDLTGEGAFEDGGVSFKLHRQFDGGWAIAAGIENLITFGDTDGSSSGYGVVSKAFQFREADEPFSSLVVSLGVGGGRFRSELDLDEETVGVFGSVGLRLLRPLSLIADWTGQDLNLGLSIAPFRRIPIVITPGVADVTGNAGDGPRFILGIGAGYSF